MYQNAYYQRQKNLIHIWDDVKGYFTMPYTRYAYERATNGEYQSIYGDRLTKIYKFNRKVNTEWHTKTYITKEKKT